MTKIRMIVKWHGNTGLRKICFQASKGNMLKGLQQTENAACGARKALAAGSIYFSVL